MFFHFLQARPQGLFISAYLGGMYIRDKHQYKRDSLKPNVRKQIRDKKIDQRLANFKKLTDDALKAFESPFLRRGDRPNLSIFKGFDPKNTLYDSSEFENIYSKKEYLLRKKAFDGQIQFIEIFAELDYDKEVKDEFVKMLNMRDEDLESYSSKFKAAITPEDIQQVAQASSASRANEFMNKLIRLRKENFQSAGEEFPEILTQAAKAIQALTATRDQAKEVVEKETKEYISEVKEDVASAFYILTAPLDEARSKDAGPSDPYIPGSGANAEPIFNPSKDSSKSNWNIAIEGEVKPEKSIVPVLGIGVGYLKSLPGHAFAGGEVYCIRPMTTINFSLKVDKPDEEPRGKLDVKVPWSIGASVIAGKCINPYVGLYVKTGIEFTNVNFTYTVDNDDIPFGKDNKSSNEEKFNLTLKPIFAGFGAMIFGEHWIIAAEYNALTFTKQTIRDYDKIGGDERKRGYAYSGLHHRLLLRLFLIANG